MNDQASVRIAAGQSRFFYGWIIVAVLAVTETVSYGVLYYAFPIFIDPMRAELGWSSSTVTGAFSLALLVSGGAAPLIGIWLDRRGPRLLMTAGSALGALFVAAWSRTSSVVAYYAIWAGIGLAMAASFYEPAFSTLTVWFDRNRRRAILAVTLVAGFSSTIFLPLANWLNERYGWRQAVLLLAAILAIVNVVPHALVLRRRPEDRGLFPDGDSATSTSSGALRGSSGLQLGSALRQSAFWWITGSFFIETFATSAVAIYLVPYLTARGNGAGFAAAAAGSIGAAQVVARLLTSLFGARVAPVTMTAIVFALQAVAIVLLLEWQSRTGVLAAVLLLGAGRGVVTLMRPALVADYFGRSGYAAISGSMALFLTGASALAPVATGAAYAFWNGYDRVFWLLAGFALIGALGMLGARAAVRPVAPMPLNE